MVNLFLGQVKPCCSPSCLSGGMAYASDLKSDVARHMGSSPMTGTEGVERLLVVPAKGSGNSGETGNAPSGLGGLRLTCY